MTKSSGAMKLRTPLILSALIISAMIGASIWAWTAIPPGQSVPVHWDLNGNINGWEPKEFALLLLPGMSILLSALLAGLTRIEPRRSNLAQSAKLYTASWIGALVILLGSHALIIAAALGIALPVQRIVPSVVGLFFAVIGNYLGKTRSNFFAGVRTPWTLSSEYSWERTHRLAGRLFVATGLATIAVSAIAGSPWDLGVLVGGALGTAVLSMVMSYVYWRRDPDRQAGKLANGA